MAKGKNVLVEDGFEKEITPERLLDILTQRHNNLEKEPIVGKKDKTIVLSIQQDNDYTQLLLKGVREFRRICSGDSDFFEQLQEPDTKYVIENICREILYNHKIPRMRVDDISLAYIGVSIDIVNKSIDLYKMYFGEWNNWENILVYMKEGELCIEEY